MNKTLVAGGIAAALVLSPVLLSAPAQATIASSAGQHVIFKAFPNIVHREDDGNGDDNHGSQGGDDNNGGWGGGSQGVIPPVVIRPHRSGDDDGKDDGKGGKKPGAIVPIPAPSPGATSAPTPQPSPSAGANLTGSSVKHSRYVVAPLDGTKQSNSAAPTNPLTTAIDPNAAPAIDLSNVQTSAKTPADRFMESASIGMTSVLMGGLALAAIAGYRTLRLRKDPRKDFFYESE